MTCYLRITYKAQFLRKLSQVNFVENFFQIKMINVNYVSSAPRCFFVNPGEDKIVVLEHISFIFDPTSDYSKNQVMMW